VVKYLHGKVIGEPLSVSDKTKLMLTIQNMIYSKDEESYQVELLKLNKIASKDFIKYFNNNWNNCKEMWVQYFRKNLTIFGTHTNNHIEAYHRKIKRQIQHSFSILCLITTLITFISTYKSRQNKYELDNLKSSTNPNTKNSVTLGLLSELLSKKGKSLLLEQWSLSKSVAYSVEFLNDNYYVKNYKESSTEYMVQIEDNKKISCTCQEFLHFGIFCRHMLVVLDSDVDHFKMHFQSFVNNLNIRWNKNKNSTINQSNELMYHNFLNTQTQQQISSQVQKIDKLKKKPKPKYEEDKFNIYNPVLKDLESFLINLSSNKFETYIPLLIGKHFNIFILIIFYFIYILILTKILSKSSKKPF
jgi:hypothetical protein